jgi:hypothetical protein
MRYEQRLIKQAKSSTFTFTCLASIATKTLFINVCFNKANYIKLHNL